MVGQRVKKIDIVRKRFVNNIKIGVKNNMIRGQYNERTA